jgi:hypothetical protein
MTIDEALDKLDQSVGDHIEGKDEYNCKEGNGCTSEDHKIVMSFEMAFALRAG